MHEKVLYAVAPGTLRQATCCTNPARTSAATWRSRTATPRSRRRSCTGADSSAGLADLALSPLVRFVKFYVLRLGFLDGLPGLVHISIGCMNSFMKYAKLIELQQGAAANERNWTRARLIDFHDGAHAAGARGVRAAGAAIEDNHRHNRLLWDEEDLARRRNVPDSEIAANKRAIDGYNQKRNDAIERIDEQLLASSFRSPARCGRQAQQRNARRDDRPAVDPVAQDPPHAAADASATTSIARTSRAASRNWRA